MSSADVSGEPSLSSGMLCTLSSAVLILKSGERMSPGRRMMSGDLVYFLITMGDLSGDTLRMSPRGLGGKSGDLSGEETSEGSGVMNLGLETPEDTELYMYYALV